MTAAPIRLDGPTLRRCAALARRDDLELAVDVLAAAATNGGRDRTSMRDVAERCAAFGGHLRLPDPDGVTIVHATGDGRTFARSLHGRRNDRVEIFDDTIARAASLVDALGWDDWFPRGSIERAALRHELAHHALADGRTRRRLRDAIGVPAMRIGRWTRTAWIARSDELVCHAAAGAGLARSPLLLTAALAVAAVPTDRDRTIAHKESSWE